MRPLSRLIHILVFRQWKLVLLAFGAISLCFAFIPKEILLKLPISTLHHSLGISVSSLQKEDPRKEALRTRMHQSQAATYNLQNPNTVDFSRGQSAIIDDLLSHKEDGFFLDVGAGDGETNSVSLFFERQRRWSGVLVEADDAKAKAANSKNRKSIVWNVRVRLDNTDEPLPVSEIRSTELFSILNRTHYDLLIINLNSWEFELIRSINFDQVRIKVITLELQIDVSREKYFEVTNYLATYGYTVAHHLVQSRKKFVIFIND